MLISDDNLLLFRLPFVQFLQIAVSNGLYLHQGNLVLLSQLLLLDSRLVNRVEFGFCFEPVGIDRGSLKSESARIYTLWRSCAALLSYPVSRP